MRIYTRTGDQGETGLGDGSRVPKDHPRVEAYGQLDELTSLLGLYLARGTEPLVEARIRSIQADLFELGSHLATPGGNRTEAALGGRIAELESWIDEWDSKAPELRGFILPGGTEASALCHVARTLCRRAERTVRTCARESEIPPHLSTYLNRLSDLLFVLARYENARAGVEELPWSGDQPS